MIRRFRAQDAAAVSVLHADTIRRVNASDYPAEQVEPWAAASSPQLFIDSMSDHVRFVYERGGRIIGFGDYVPSTGQLPRLYVSADHQREGIGRELYERIEADARRRGIGTLWLRSTTNAAHFYASMGFSRVRDDTFEIDGSELAAVVMEKHLGDHDA